MKPSEWMKIQKENWPDGSKERALGGKSVLEALKEKTKKKDLNEAPPALSLESWNNEELALGLAGLIIKDMHRLGVRRDNKNFK